MTRTTYGVDEETEAEVAEPIHRHRTARWWIAGIALALALAGTGYALSGPSEQEIQDKYTEYQGLQRERAATLYIVGGASPRYEELTGIGLAMERKYAKAWAQRGYAVRR